jgi:hypothetical protein
LCAIANLPPSRVRPMRRLEARFRPAGRLTFFAYGSPPGAKKVSKETHPDIRVSLRSTSLPPVLLRGPAYKGHLWPFKRGRLVLSPHPCGSSLCATPTLGLLTGKFARMTVSSLKPLSAVGMPRRKAGETRAAGLRELHPFYLIVSTLQVGMQPQAAPRQQSAERPRVPTQSLGTIKKCMTDMENKPAPIYPGSRTYEPLIKRPSPEIKCIIQEYRYKWNSN